MRTMIGFAVFALVLVAVNVNAQDDDTTDLRFAVMVDTTVFPEGVAAVVQHSCSITDVYEAVDDPKQQCHTEAMEMCYQMGDECGGYVIEPASIDLEPEKRISINFNNPFNREPVRVVQADVEYTRERGIVVKIIKAGAAEDINNLVTVAGATLYEKRTIGSDPALLAQLYEQKISEKVDDAIAGHSEIHAIEAEIERRVRKVNSARSIRGASSSTYARYGDRELSVMLAELKMNLIEEMFEDELAIYEKSGFNPQKPIVRCTPGSFTGGIQTYATYTPAVLPTFTKKKCTLSQFTPKLCACTAPVFAKKACTGDLFIPKRPPVFIPKQYIHPVYEPPFCDIEYVEVGNPHAFKIREHLP